MRENGTMHSPLETIVRGGRVWTGEGEWEMGAVGIAGKRVAAVGPLEELAKRASPETEWVDAEGGWILSGFRESRLHLTSGERIPTFPPKEKPVLRGGISPASAPQTGDKPGLWERIWGRKAISFRKKATEGAKGMGALPDPTDPPFRRVDESEAEQWQWERAVLRVQKAALKCGVTHLECDEAVGPEGWRILWRVLEGLERRGVLRVRIRLHVGISSIDSFVRFLQTGLKTGAGSPRVRMGAVQVTHAGSGAGGFSREELKRLSYLAHANGFQLIYRVPDGPALNESFNAILYAHAYPRRRMTNHRVYLPPVLNEAVLHASEQLSAILEMPPEWLGHTWVALREKRHPERSMEMYDWLTEERLLRICSGGDRLQSPVRLIRDTTDALIGILSEEKPTMNRVRIEQMARLAALRAVTAPVRLGQPADLAVLNADPLSVPLDALPDVAVRLTFVDGKTEYRR